MPNSCHSKTNHNRNYWQRVLKEKVKPELE